jgi:hypothetical protein
MKHGIGNLTIIGTLLMLCALEPCLAQMEFPGKPMGPSRQLKAAEVLYVLPPVDPLEVEARKEANRTGQAKALEFALERPVDLTPETQGAWIQRAGSLVWQVHILSPGAFSLGLVFNQYKLENGVKVFVYDPELHQVKGAFNSANNKRSGILPVGHISGEELIVEMQVPQGLSDYGELRIESISHGFEDLEDLSGLLDCNPGTFGCSQACMVDINCQEGAGWQTEKRSVVRIYTTRQYCTGVLVNNTGYDGTPYILTAEHCISSQQYANLSVFLFNYESPDCFGEDGSKSMSIAGSDFLAVGDSIDFSLVRLSTAPPLSYEPYYAGWDRSDNIPPSTSTIHHPFGDVKKITIDKEAPSKPSKPEDVPYTDLDVYHYFSYWWIRRWDVGSTQAGSSGSPLFSNTGRVIGLLSGGIARCGDSIGYDADNNRVIYSNVFNYDDYYSRMAYAWDYSGQADHSLREWLDPGNTGSTSIGGYEPVGIGSAKEVPSIRYSLYPNPVQGTLYLKSDLMMHEAGFYEILNLSGGIVNNGQLEARAENRVEVAALDPGIYLLRITGDWGWEVHKFVIIP